MVAFNQFLNKFHILVGGARLIVICTIHKQG
jgi:hypothetical protein